MSVRSYPPHELQPRHLTPAETTNPALAIDGLFSYFHLPQAREILWQWFSVTVAGNYHKALSRSQRQDIICLYEQVEKLLEAAHIMYMQGREADNTGG